MVLDSNPMSNSIYSHFEIFVVDCNWSNWGSWKSCEDRFKKEYRLRIKAPNGYENCKGKACEGDEIEERPCRGIFNLKDDSVWNDKHCYICRINMMYLIPSYPGTKYSRNYY